MYIVLETQTNANKQVGTLIFTYGNQNEALSKYHQILAAAAISSVPQHTAYLLEDNGLLIKSETFNHLIEDNE